MKYWLVKTEPGTYSIDDLKRDKSTEWHGVRNYQARNFLKEMSVNDKVFIYHSVQNPVGIAGIAEVLKTAQPDKTQFDKNSNYFDEKSTKDSPRWFCPEIRFSAKFKQLITLNELKQKKILSKMHLLKKGSRLSVQPVTRDEYQFIMQMAES